MRASRALAIKVIIRTQKSPFNRIIIHTDYYFFTACTYIPATIKVLKFLDAISLNKIITRLRSATFKALRACLSSQAISTSMLLIFRSNRFNPNNQHFLFFFCCFHISRFKQNNRPLLVDLFIFRRPIISIKSYVIQAFALRRSLLLFINTYKHIYTF